MKKRILLFLTIISGLTVYGQSANDWQQETNYNINVRLNDSSHTLDGQISIHYINHSPDTLRFIWLHLWPNAYKNDKTAFSDQLLENGETDFYFSKESDRGYINSLNFSVNGVPAIQEDHPQHQDIVRLLLPDPLLPGRDVKISTAFHVQLPKNISRGGHIGQSYQITQWYPKPAVYDRLGWHPIPYLDQGEFYADFGKYDVSVTVPSGYLVASTGILTDSSSQGNLLTLHFKQDRIHDFAWFADRDFIQLHDTMHLGSKTIDLYLYCNKNNRDKWKNGIAYMRRAISTKSQWLGNYPYDVMTVVERPGKDNLGGMEYPTITLISHPGNEALLDHLINHETGHNWFYGILASNERKHPWMDEGMNSFYDMRYRKEFYPNGHYLNSRASSFFKKRMPDDLEDFVLASVISIHKDQPIETTADSFHYVNYGVIPYRKAGQWMELLEKKLGRETFDSMMQAYFRLWQFKHPYPDDFKSFAETFTGKDLSFLFYLLNSTGSLQPRVKKTFRVTSFINLKDAEKHNDLFIAPAAGYNMYDRFMVGALLHNYTLPLSRFHFLLAPLYATGSKKFNGLGRLSYDHYFKRSGATLTLALSGARFTADDFTDSTGTRNPQPVSKLVPQVRFRLGNKNPRSTFSAYLQWKTYLINETGLSFSRDTIQQLDIISYPTRKRYLNQFRAVLENNRALYPYQAMMDVEQGKGFIRLALTGRYFFNYPGGGGLQTRLFAGKFIYTGAKTFLTQFETDRYHLNLTGPNGYEDYQYANYFIGRNEYEGLANQQIMVRDGAFKVRSDLLSQKIGKTDDWLAALNLCTTIPKQINPLSVLPVKIPLKLFADIGTYAEAWKNNAATGRFLYDAGFQLSLLNDLVNIYVPVLYSKVYKDYFKSTITEKRFLKNISFSIDIQNVSSRKLFPQNIF